MYLAALNVFNFWKSEPFWFPFYGKSQNDEKQLLLYEIICWYMSCFVDRPLSFDLHKIVPSLIHE